MENNFQKRDAFYLLASIAIRIHIYRNFLSSPEENLYSPVRIVSIILAFADVTVGCFKELLYFYKVSW